MTVDCEVKPLAADQCVGLPEGINAGFSSAQRRWTITGVLFAIDTATVMSALLAANAVAGGATFGIEWAFVLVVCPVIFTIAGLYGFSEPNAIERLRRRTLAAIAICGCDVVMHGPFADISTGVARALAMLTLLIVLGHYLEALAARILRRAGIWQARALIVGDFASVDTLIRQLLSRPELGLQPSAALVRPAAPVGKSLALPLPMLSSLAEINNSIDVLLPAGSGTVAMLRDDAQLHGLLPLATWMGTAAEDDPHVSSRPPRRTRREAVKRLTDIVLALVCAIPAAIIVGAAAGAVKLLNGGPAFYHQQRTGQHGKDISVLKIRTMYLDADKRLADHLRTNGAAEREWYQYFKLKHDPRVLPWVGQFIRRNSIDEIPQIWNVIRGDMSLVGPRPFPKYHLDKLDSEFRAQRERVPAGLTGLWQISGRSEGDLEAQKAADIFYVRYNSVWLDFYILLQTVPAVLTAKGAW